MSAVALLAWAVFTWWILRKERESTTGVSRAAWLPTLWMLYFASKPIARWLDPQGEIDDSPLDRYFLLGLMFAGCLVLKRRQFDWQRRVRQNGWLVLLLGYMLVSCFWTDAPFGAFKQWIRVFGSAIMPMVLLSEQNPREALRSLMVRTTYVLVPLSVILIKYVPNLGVEYRAWNGEEFWVGACLQKNGLGRMCLVAAVFLVWNFFLRIKGRNPATWKYQNWVELGMLAQIAWLFKGPGSNYPVTAIAVVFACALVLGLLLLSKPSTGRAAFTAVSILVVVIGIAMSYVSVTGQIPTFGVQEMGRDATFTGRTDIWNGVRRVAWENSIFGVGYSGYWSHPHEFPNVGTVNEGHNGYLDTFVETGLIGEFLMLVCIAAFVYKAFQERDFDYDWASYRLAFALMLLLHNFTESSLLRSSAHLWVLFLCLFVSVPRRDDLVLEQQTIPKDLGTGAAPAAIGQAS